MNARYVHVSPISPLKIDICYENPHPIRSRYPIFRTLLRQIASGMEHWNKKAIEISFESMFIQNVRSLSRIRLQGKELMIEKCSMG